MKLDLTDYAGMELQPKENNTLKCDLAPWSDGILVKASTPSVSPWRYVMISDKLSDIVEKTSAISLNLNPPSRIADTSWIKPGKYVGHLVGNALGQIYLEPQQAGASRAPMDLGATTQKHS